MSHEDRERRIAEDLARLDAMNDEDIDLSDTPEITDEQWSRAVPNPFYRPVEDEITLRIDHDVLAWFRAADENYLTAMNSALREHMERHRNSS